MAEKTQYDRVKEITDQLEAGISQLFESDQYKQWLTTMGRFHDYSLNNTLLIAMQKPDATLVAGYTTWQKQFGRQVNKGEKAIRILAPTPYKQKVEVDKTDPNTGEILMNADGSTQKEIQEVLRPAFKVVNVFDVSQTDGRELPSLGVNELAGDVAQYEIFFEALKRTCPVPISFEQIAGGAKGYYHQMERRIAIQEGMSQIQTVKTAIHEMAHQKLHAINPDRKIADQDLENITRGGKEVEAESVAYAVCQYYGIDTSDYSFAYIAGWSQGKETPELKASLNRIRKAASEMINDIDGHMKDLRLEHVVAADIKNIQCVSSEYIPVTREAEHHFTAELFGEPIKLTMTVSQHDDGEGFVIHSDGNDIWDKVAESELRKLEPVLENAATMHEWQQRLEKAEDLESVRDVRYGLMETENLGLSREQYCQLQDAVDEKEILFTKEAAYQIGYDYLEIHEASDGSWDFTLYGPNCKEIDGGQLGNSEQTNIIEAAKEVAAYYQLADQPMTLMNRDDLETLVGFYNPELSGEQMHFVGEVISQGFDPKEYWVGGKAMDLTAQPLGTEQIADIKYQVQVDSIPKMFYTAEQWHEIEAGIAEKLDVLSYANPSLSSEQMREMREELKAPQQMDDYELKPVPPAEEKAKAPKKQAGKKKSLLADLHEKQAKVSGANAPADKSKSKSKEME